MGFFNRGRKKHTENLIRALEEKYFKLKEQNPDQDEHWLLANTWLEMYGSTEQAKQRGAEWATFAAYKSSCQYSVLESPKSIRALALSLVYEELGEWPAINYAIEFYELVEPIRESKESNTFLEQYKKRNPQTWKENQVENNSRYSLYWFFKGLESLQEYPKEAEEAPGKYSARQRIEREANKLKGGVKQLIQGLKKMGTKVIRNVKKPKKQKDKQK